MKRIAGGVKDENGIFIPSPRQVEPVEVKVISPVQRPDVSLDDILTRELITLDRVTKALAEKSVAGLNDKEIASLATCIKITLDWKLKEKEALDNMSTEELEEHAKADSDRGGERT